MSALQNLHLRACSGLRHRHATVALAGLSFAESTILPVPTVCLLLPMSMARPLNTWQLTVIATVASTLGSIYGYALGHLGYQWVDTRYGDWVNGNWLAAILNGFDHWGVWVVLIAGLLPLPFRFVAIGAGVTGMGIVPFVLTAAIGRGIQFTVASQLAVLLSRKTSPLFTQSTNSKNLQ